MSDLTSDTYGGGNRGTGEWPGSDRTSDDNTRDSNKPGMMQKAKDAMGMGSSGRGDDYDNDRNTSGRGDDYNVSSNNRGGMTTGGDYDSSNTRSGMGSSYDDSSNTRSGMGTGYDDSTTRSSGYDSTTRSGMGSGYDDSNTRSSGYTGSTTTTGTSGSTLIDSTLGSTKGYDSFANPNAGARSLEEFTSGTTGTTGLHTSRDTSDTYGSGRTTDTYGTTGRDTTSDTYGSTGRDTSDTYGSSGTGDYGGERQKSSGLSAGAGGDSSTRDLSDRYDATANTSDDYATGDRKASGRDTYGSSNITTADSYGTGNTGKESFMDKMKEKVGLGSSKDKTDNY